MAGSLLYTRGATATPGDVALSAPVVVLVAALAAGVVAQGGYYPAGRVLVTVLVAVTVALALRIRRWTRADAWPVSVAAAALAGWTLLRAVMADAYPTAIGEVVTLACGAAVLTVLYRPARWSGSSARRPSSGSAYWWR